MPSTVTDPIAEALKSAIAGITGLSNGVTVKTYKWPPRSEDLDAQPAAVVELPSIERSDLDGAEDHLGANDWEFTFGVTFYFDLGNPDFSQAQAAEVIEAFIAAVDADQDLSGTCQEAKVQVDRAEYVEGESKPIIRWPTRVLVLKFVTT